MLDILEKHIKGTPKECIVLRWISSLPQEEQEAFKEVAAHNEHIHLAALYGDLKKQADLPFKLTAFRSHFRGYCTCQH